MFCTCCFSLEHRVLNCPNNRQEKKCTVCKRTGHTRTQCPHQDQCGKCHRSSTQQYKISLRDTPINYKRRAYGDTILPNDKVCDECFKYCDPSNAEPGWESAWPSFFYSLITSNKFGFDPNVIISVLPLSLRRMYDKCIPILSESLKHLWNLESETFLDATLRVDEYHNFKKSIGNKTLENLMKICNETCKPIGRCPEGCLIYPEEEDEVQYIKLSHWLAFKNSKFRDFHADFKHFIGKKPAWPSIVENADLGCNIGACVYMHKQLGLVIIACSNNKHADGHHKFAHPPPNPMGDMSDMTNDKLSPIAVTPNIARQSRTTKYNNSSTVFKEYSSAGGMASFTLNPRPVICNESLHDRKLMGLALDNRNDVSTMLSRDGGAFQSVEKFDAFLKEYRSRWKLPDQEVDEAISNGTVISKNDAINMYAASRDLKKSESNFTAASYRKHREKFVEMVHPPTEVGAALFEIDNVHASIGDSCLFLIISALLHCRYLLMSFIKKGSLVSHSLHKLISLSYVKVSRGMAINKRSVGSALVRWFSSKLPACSAMSTGLIASYFLQEFSCNVSIEHLSCVTAKITNQGIGYSTRDVSSHKIEALFCNSYLQEKDLLIIHLRNACVEPPESVDGKRWALLYAAECNQSGEFFTAFHASRWNENLHWQYSNNMEHTSILRSGRYTFLIYVNLHGSGFFNREKYLNMSGGQSKLKCANHLSYFMMRENVKGSRFLCHVHKCMNKISWRCSSGYGGVDDNRCVVGVCAKHGKEVLTSKEHEGIIIEQSSVKTTEDSSSESGESSSEFEDDNSDEVDNMILDESSLVLTEFVYEDSEVLFTTLAPATFLDETELVGGHFLIKGLIDSTNKSARDGNMSIKWHKLLTYVHSIVDEKFLPLLYVEGLLFPKIFYALCDGAPVGALPSIFYSEFGHDPVFLGYASFTDHMMIRMRDHTLMTARDKNYIAWTFDCYMNKLLNKSNRLLVMKKGYEHITPIALSADDSEFLLGFDEIDSRKQISNLSSMMKYFPWDFF